MSNIAHTYYPQSGRLVILGAGESGVGAAILGKDKGFDVFVSDMGQIADSYKQILEKEQISFEEGKHSEELILNADLLVKSPGIPEKAPLIKQLRSLNKPLISEIEFAAQYTDAKLYCITGSNGKTTTTMLTYTLLKNAGLDVGLAGNIGNSFALQVARDPHACYVLEISSFMLDDMFEFKADISVLLNITPDHLDRYDYKMSNYIKSKFRIVQNQTEEDHFIYCDDDENIKEFMASKDFKMKKYPFSIEHEIKNGAYLTENKLMINLSNSDKFDITIQDLAIQGKHNTYNSMASGITAKILDIRKESIRESMGNYKNIDHRLEFVANVSGITFINDSKATNVNSVWYALESIKTDIILIMGGVDKGNDYTMLKSLVRDKVKAIICLGKDNKALHDAFEEDVEVMVNTFSASEAVQIAYHMAKKGSTVLLSPACASFDLFKNYEDRGDQFKAAVKEL
mgnify:CR=1 FL=1